jgi:hypothetical protein
MTIININMYTKYLQDACMCVFSRGTLALILFLSHSFVLCMYIWVPGFAARFLAATHRAAHYLCLCVPSGGVSLMHSTDILYLWSHVTLGRCIQLLFFGHAHSEPQQPPLNKCGISLFRCILS